MALRSSIKILSNAQQNVMQWSPTLARAPRAGLAVRVPLEGAARGVSGRAGGRGRSCAPAERPACAPPCAGARRPCCRARHPRQPPAVRVRCCPPGAGCRPPCAPPCAAGPLACPAPAVRGQSDPPRRAVHTSSSVQQGSGPCREQTARHSPLDPRDFVPPPDPERRPGRAPYASETRRGPARREPLGCAPKAARACAAPGTQKDLRGESGGAARGALDQMHFEDEAFSSQIDRVARRLASEAAERRQQYEVDARVQECHRRLHAPCNDQHADECRAFLKQKCIKEKCCSEECREFCSKCENSRQEHPGHGYKLDAMQTVDATGIDGKLYSLRPLPCERWSEMKKCGPNRETPPPEHIPLKHNQNSDNCHVKEHEYLDPCGHKPPIIIEIDRTTDPKVIARENDKKIIIQLKKEDKKKLYQKIQKLSQEHQNTDTRAPKSKPKKGFTDRIKELTGCKKKDDTLYPPPDESKSVDKPNDCKPSEREGTCGRSSCEPACNMGENPNLRVGNNSWCGQNIEPHPVPEKCVEVDFRQKLKWRNSRGKCEPVGSVVASQTTADPRIGNANKENMPRSIPQTNMKRPCKPCTNKQDTRKYHTSDCRNSKLCGYNLFPTKKGAKQKTYSEILKQTEEDLKNFKSAMTKREKLKETGLGRLLGEDMCPCQTSQCPEMSKPSVGPSLTGCLKIQMPCEPDDKKIRVEMCIDNTLLEFARVNGHCVTSSLAQEVKKPFECPKGGKLPTLPMLPTTNVGLAKIHPEEAKSESEPHIPKLDTSAQVDQTDNQKHKESLNKKDETGKKQPPSGHTTDCPSSRNDLQSKSEPSLTTKDPKPRSTIDSIKNAFKTDSKKAPKNSLCDKKIPPKSTKSKDPSCKFSSLPNCQRPDPNSSIQRNRFDIPKELTALLPNDFQKIINDLDKYEAYIDQTERELRASEEENIRNASITRFTILKDFLWSKFSGSFKTNASDPIVW